MLIGPWRIEDAEGGRLVYGVSGERAARRWLEVGCEVRRAAERDRLVSEGAVRWVRLWAWRVCLLRARGREWFVHAEGRDAARARGVAEFGCRADEVWVEPTDDVWVLHGLSGQELELQCRFVWSGSGASKASELARRVPTLGARTGRVRKGFRPVKGELSAGARAQAVYALALAQLVEGFGPSGASAQVAAMWAEGGASARRRLTRPENVLHGENVPRAVLEECRGAGLRVGGPEPEPWTAAQRAALARLARAYGYDPERMTPWGLMRLWRKGPDG